MLDDQANFYLVTNDLCRTKYPFDTIEQVMKAFRKYVCDNHDMGYASAIVLKKMHSLKKPPYYIELVSFNPFH